LETIPGAERTDWLTKVVAALDKAGIFSRWVNVLGISALFLMVVMTFINVIARYVFNHPFIGIVEVTEVLMVSAVFLSVAHTQNQKAHVAVDLFTAKLKPKNKIVMGFINNLLAIALFIIVIWRSADQMVFFIEKHTVHSPFLAIPNAPFAAIIVFGCSLTCILLIRDLLRDIIDARKLGLTCRHWVLMLGIPIIIGVLAFFWSQPGLWEISLPLVGLLGVIVTLIFMFMGMPIAFGLFLTSYLFIAHIRGEFTALNMISVNVYRTAASYSWSALPFFVLMGFICLYANFGTDLFKAAYKWFGHMKGGMGMATIGACASFGAIIGDGLSATATMTAVALPEMKKINYDDALSAGCIVAGASLGPIIPPSVIFIIFGILTGVSIGDLFVAGIIPGLIMTACFVVTVYIWCRIFPKSAPAGDKSGWKARFISLKAGGPVMILFVLVIGGIYLGVFTPTEGGAIGAVVALILGLIYKRFNFRSFYETLLESGQIMCMTFLTLIGAVMFNIFLGWCNVTSSLTNLIVNAHLSPLMFIIIILFFLTVAGCFINVLSLILIGIPIFFPIVKTLGIDPIWFLILSGIAMNLGNITPPVGINLFILKGMRPETSMNAIYKGSLPFSIATLIAIIFIYVIPASATWLPVVLK
jgi:tripartite ATP-independent transporter DctM subunit